jgi:hypothetical protein
VHKTTQALHDWQRMNGRAKPFCKSAGHAVGRVAFIPDRTAPADESSEVVPVSYRSYRLQADSQTLDR